MAADGWTALAESTGRLPGLALNLAQLQQQGQQIRALEADSAKRLAIEGERLGIEKINATRQKDLYEIQKREADMKLTAAERDMELIPVSETLASLGVKRPLEQKFLMDYAGPYIQKGPASGLPSIQRNHAQEIYGKLLKDIDANIKLDTIRAGEAQKEIEAIDAQMTNPETSGKLKPEQIAQLQKQRAELVMERTVSDNSVRRLTREKGKENLKNFWNPDTQSWVQKNIVTDDVTGLIPEEVKKAQITAGGLDRRAEEANRTRLKAAEISAGKSTGKEPTSVDKKRLLDLVNIATNRGTEEPTENDVTIIQDMANKLGYDFTKTTTITPGTIWGTNEKSEWKLVPKGGGGTAPPKFTAVNAKGVKIFSNDGVTWTDAKGKVVK